MYFLQKPIKRRKRKFAPQRTISDPSMQTSAGKSKRMEYKWSNEAYDDQNMTTAELNDVSGNFQDAVFEENVSENF